MEFGEPIKRLRNEAGMTQEQFAKKPSCDVSSYLQLGESPYFARSGNIAAN